ncbi:MAG: BamA/TamA family outer membrane protein [Rhodothermia bacterium]|nr:BamA/TamA family outer membrane protein [Rhodothermia bacterium]
MLLTLPSVGQVVAAQTPDPQALPPVVTVVDGKRVNFNELSTFPVDSLEVIVDATLRRLRDEGHLRARIDSVTGENPTSVFVSSGPLMVVHDIRFTGSPVLDEAEMLRLMETGYSKPLRQSELERDIVFVLRRHAQLGWPLAEASIASITPVPEQPDRLSIVIRIERGPAVTLHRIRLDGANRTNETYVARLTGLAPGKRLEEFDAAEIRRRLLATNLFREVGTPELVIRTEGDADVVIELEEEPPGNFDLVLGYIPETTAATNGGVVGNGHLELRNLFGGGRLFNLRLNRLPGRVSSVDVGVADPNIVGLPLGVEGTFHGTQQDSTYDQQRYSAGVSYEVSDGLRLVAGASREVTKPGQAGLQLRSRRQRIPRSTASFFGIGVRYESVDFPVNPRSGLRVESMFERGNKNRTARFIEEAGDTLVSRTRLNQERLTLRVRYFVPTLKRQLIAIGADAQLLLSDEYDESDLIRFGGASSLRGYNEQQFLGRLASRILLEYRYQLDRWAFAYMFVDLGVLETAPTDDVESRRDLLPGFGVGTQFRTEIGIINVSYAFNDEDGPIDGRIHVGLSFSL